MLTELLLSFMMASPAPKASEEDLGKLKLEPQAIARLGIELAPVERGPQQRTISVPGTILPRPGASASITAPIAGTIVPPPNLDEPPLPGTMVLAEQTVLRLRPFVTPTGTVLTETKREVKQAEVRHDTAKKSVARAETLLKNGAGDRAQLDAAEEALEVAAAELAAARERLMRLEKSPMSADVSMPLRAPMAGVLSRIYVSSGQSVSQGEKLADVVDLSRLWVRAEVFSGIADRIDPKAEAQVHAIGRKETKRAVRLDAPFVARGSLYELDYAIEDASGLVPSSRVQVEIPLLGSEEDVLSVPWSAVLYDAQGGAWVYVAIDETTFKRARIEVESVVGDRAVLAQGPQAGARVVAQGATELFGLEFGIGK